MGKCNDLQKDTTDTAIYLFRVGTNELMIINSMEQDPFFEQLIVTQLVKRFPTFYGTQIFINLFT
jgi:hypothetical protein